MTLYAFVLTVKYAKEYWISKTYKITKMFNMRMMRLISSHSKKLFFFPLCNGFSNCLNGDLLSHIFDCLFEALLICSRQPNPAEYPKCIKIKIWRI